MIEPYEGPSAAARANRTAREERERREAAREELERNALIAEAMPLLQKLADEHGIYLSACGCCGGIWVKRRGAEVDFNISWEWEEGGKYVVGGK